jgi:branched-chain amino acid transport system substrate-binding protein
MKIVNGNSDPSTVTTNYTQLISQDHVDFTLGPFSSLLAAPAAQVAARHHYAFPEAAGGAPSVFDRRQGLTRPLATQGR